jgi:single-strand selective monofunctional uracil DNA glycosylase
MSQASERRVRRLKRLSRDLARGCAVLRFDDPVTHVSNPLLHARKPHDLYLEKYGGLPGRTLLLGMNPGPWGMSQTGVPFGDPELVRSFLHVEAPVQAPTDAHPKRPVLGFDSKRSEVSGKRVWGWAQARFGTASAFFERFFVVNYCPLAFMEEGGRNRTPDKLPAAEREALFEVCNRALVRLVEITEPERLLGIGAFAEDRAREALVGTGVPIGRVLHPSPASPVANRGWAEAAEKQLAALGVALPGRRHA